jgi:hypothetical protein
MDLMTVFEQHYPIERLAALLAGPRGVDEILLPGALVLLEDLDVSADSDVGEEGHLAIRLCRRRCSLA